MKYVYMFTNILSSITAAWQRYQNKNTKSKKSILFETHIIECKC